MYQLKFLSRLFARFSSKTGSYSIAGRKGNQEDAYLLLINSKKIGLVIVADGVGGHRHGDFASKMCISIFNEEFSKLEDTSEIKEFLKTTTYKVAANLLNKSDKDSDYTNAGTTVTGFVYTQNKFYVLNVGDSRVYYLSNNQITQVTKDHSIVQQLIDNGMLTKTQASAHPQRNVMTSAIGQPLDKIKIDIFGPYKLSKGDTLLACSDGVHDYITENQIKEILTMRHNPNKMAKSLVLAAYNAGSQDNITACILTK